MVQDLFQDTRYALRTLKKSPGFTAAVVAILALGLGANGAALSVLARLVAWHPPGVSDPSRVKRIHQRFKVPQTGQQIVRDVFSYPEFREIAKWGAAGRDQAIVGHYSETLLVGTESSPQSSVVTYVAGDYFGLLGVRAEAGRLLQRGEYDAEDLTPVVVISDRLWAKRFGRSPEAFQKPLQVGSQRLTVIGVTPPAFQGVGLAAADLWIPFNAAGSWARRSRHYDKQRIDLRFQLLALAMSTEEASAVKLRVDKSLNKVGVVPTSVSGAALAPLARVLGPQRDNGIVNVVGGLVGASLVILVIACANIAHLQMIRAVRRKREFAIRFALGATRGRVVRQTLTESVLLAGLGALPALLTGAWIGIVLQRTLLPDVNFAAAPFDWRVAAIVAVMGVCAGISIGALPIVASDQYHLSDSLRSLTNETSPKSSRWLAATLALQTALSVLLVVAASLFVRSFSHVKASWGGEVASDVIFASIPFEQGWLERGPEIADRVVDLASRFKGMAGVEEVAWSTTTPVTSVSTLSTFLPDRDSVPNIAGLSTYVSVVSAGYFKVMATPIRQGRDFRSEDVMGREAVVLVSALMARTYWPGQNAIGKCIMIGRRDSACRRVVGVVADVHALRTLEPPSLRFYVPIAQMADERWAPHVAVIRSKPGRAKEVRFALNRATTSGRARSFTWQIESLGDLLEPELRPWRLSASLFAALAVLALVVTATGIYAAVAYATTQREREIGIRRALGARPIHIVRLVTRTAMQPICLGIVLGAGLAVALARFVSSLIYDVSPYDPIALLVGALVIATAAVLASSIPTLRATRIEPSAMLAGE